MKAFGDRSSVADRKLPAALLMSWLAGPSAVLDRVEGRLHRRRDRARRRGPRSPCRPPPGSPSPSRPGAPDGGRAPRPSRRGPTGAAPSSGPGRCRRPVMIVVLPVSRSLRNGSGSAMGSAMEISSLLNRPPASRPRPRARSSSSTRRRWSPCSSRTPSLNVPPVPQAALSTGARAWACPLGRPVTTVTTRDDARRSRRRRIPASRAGAPSAGGSTSRSPPVEYTSRVPRSACHLALVYHARGRH